MKLVVFRPEGAQDLAQGKRHKTLWPRRPGYGCPCNIQPPQALS